MSFYLGKRVLRLKTENHCCPAADLAQVPLGTWGRQGPVSPGMCTRAHTGSSEVWVLHGSLKVIQGALHTRPRPRTLPDRPEAG